jgi:hypothetical protein
MAESSDCPGRHKCHGPASWCDTCATEVDLVCDDPNCEVHARGDERRREEAKARLEYAEALAESNAKQRAWLESLASLQRWAMGNPVMVARMR